MACNTSWPELARLEAQARFVRPHEYAKLHGVSVSTIYRWIKRGIITPPRRIGPGVVGWPAREAAANLKAAAEGRLVAQTA